MGTQALRNDSCVLLRSPRELHARPRATIGRSIRAHSGAHDARDRYEIAIRITRIDCAIIRGHLNEHYVAPASGPGSRSHFATGERLARGARLEPLPPELEAKLSVLPAGYQRMLAGCDVLLVRSVTREIIDVMYNARAAGGGDASAAPSRPRVATAIHIADRGREDSAARWRIYERVCVL